MRAHLEDGGPRGVDAGLVQEAQGLGPPQRVPHRLGPKEGSSMVDGYREGGREGGGGGETSKTSVSSAYSEWLGGKVRVRLVDTSKG